MHLKKFEYLLKKRIYKKLGFSEMNQLKIFFFYFRGSASLIFVKIWTPVFTFYFWLINLIFVFQVLLNFDKEILEISDLYFNEESDYSEENTSDKDDFRYTILQLFQFEPEQKKNVW